MLTVNINKFESVEIYLKCTTLVAIITSICFKIFKRYASLFDDFVTCSRSEKCKIIAVHVLPVILLYAVLNLAAVLDFPEVSERLHAVSFLTFVSSEFLLKVMDMMPAEREKYAKMFFFTMWVLTPVPLLSTIDEKILFEVFSLTLFVIAALHVVTAFTGKDFQHGLFKRCQIPIVFAHISVNCCTTFLLFAGIPKTTAGFGMFFIGLYVGLFVYMIAHVMYIYLFAITIGEDVSFINSVTDLLFTIFNIYMRLVFLYTYDVIITAPVNY